ncbi:Protein of unknown function [Muriicola jejuensis]|uniref:DUF3078 domain-containing protein n=1 Tax=Muriicola jejuensis TaxID=504488 RepID=A0A6P0UCW6_9FLAO|nr:DUF3078 domain-containing protein [Muriicola jejuensis]NER09749.1 DUF3078 domain-containing protein [Muriicola jejuensis]SMP06067.1 Protein of unknown function [Muriicola jejuensis]
MRFDKLIAFFAFLLWLPFTATGQDTIPATQEPDTTVVDTIVIRSIQEKIQYIPRGVNLTNPVISFKTKPRTRRFNRFKIPSFWEVENNLGLNLSEVAFVNWNAGGDNAFSALANAKFVRNYKFRYVQWNNDLVLRYGVNVQEGQKLRKTEDAIRFSSSFGYRRDTLTSWYYSAKVKFNTQFSNGYKYPDRTAPISRFMAPGYLFVGAGISYIPEGKNFNLYMSPLTQKATFVLDQNLANDGAFGVEKAVRDSTGTIIREGENKFIEVGISVTNEWKTPVWENVTMDHRLSLYTDYLRSFGNVDIDWELNFVFTVNEFLKANFGTQIIYDDDIRFNPVVADDGSILSPGVPRIQFRQLLAIGLSYSF